MNRPTIRWDTLRSLPLFFITLLVLATSSIALRGLYPAWVELPRTAEEKIDPRLFKFLTFGHWPVGIDALWMRSLQDRILFYDLDLATDLDPAYFEAYFYGANALAVIWQDAEGARKLLVKAETFMKNDLPSLPQDFKDRYWPQPWRISVVLGYVYLFELGDMPRAAESFRRGAAYLGAPEYLQSLGRRLEQPGGEYEVGLRLLNFMMAGSKDPVQRSSLEKKRKSLFVAQHLAYITREFDAFLKTQSEYRSRTNVPPSLMRQYWRRFLKKSRIPERDPFGGHVTLTISGKLATSTPHERIFGLD